MGVHCPFIGVENVLIELIFSDSVFFSESCEMYSETYCETVKDMNIYVVTLTLILVTIHYMIQSCDSSFNLISTDPGCKKTYIRCSRDWGSHNIMRAQLKVPLSPSIR